MFFLCFIYYTHYIDDCVDANCNFIVTATAVDC